MPENEILYNLNISDLATSIQDNLELDPEDLVILVSEILNLREEEVHETLSENEII